jgi:hypothetical protein
LTGTVGVGKSVVADAIAAVLQSTVLTRRRQPNKLT